VLSFVKKALEHVENAAFKDYKTLLQEIIQKNPEERLTYMLVGESGPDHDKRFEVDVMLNSNVIGHGIGKSKKAAEQHAAKEALELMGQ
jgi:ribonuclease-3